MSVNIPSVVKRWEFKKRHIHCDCVLVDWGSYMYFVLQFRWSLTLTWENELVTWWKQLGNQNRTTWIKLLSSYSYFFNCTSLSLQRFWLVEIFSNFKLFLFLFVPVHTPLFCWYTLSGGGILRIHFLPQNKWGTNARKKYAILIWTQLGA